LPSEPLTFPPYDSLCSLARASVVISSSCAACFF
jgi:hypothetical protein